MDVFPKFIIEGDNLIIAKCTYHKQLVTNPEEVKGGGWWRLDDETKTFILHGNSHDYGAATIEDIKDCISKNNVYMDRRHYREFPEDYSIAYDTQCEIIKLK